MRMKLDKFDCAVNEQETEEPDVEDQAGASLATTTTPEEPLVHFHLGAPEKNEKPLSDLTGIANFSVSNLPHMLEEFLNRFRTQEEGYYRARKEHTVSALTPLLPVES